MTLASQKLQQNVAEYLLFLWQMEDLVRAFSFDLDTIAGFVRSYAPEGHPYDEEVMWFGNLILNMRNDGVEKRGHISEAHELMLELSYLHNSLINITKDREYIDSYNEARPNILAYLERSSAKTLNDVEVCLTALYGLLVLKLRKEPVSQETEAAMQTFSQLLARLSHHYRLMKQMTFNFYLN